MKKYKFGLEVLPYDQKDSLDFAAFSAQNTTENNNPYGGTFFTNKDNMPSANKDSDRRITSVPSPYARMHLTDLAFEELIAHKLNPDDVSDDYIKAMSHCLDMFELFFRFDQLDLLEKGIHVERVELVSRKHGDTRKWEKFLNEHSNVRNYIDTLDLFRQQYLDVIENANTPNFTFKFTDLYMFKGPDGRTFGSTSPFTGFFTTAECDLTKLNISIRDNGYSHKYLTANSLDWKLLNQRPLDFQNFMFILLNPEQKQGGLGNIFKNLFQVVKLTIGTRATELKGINFCEQYPQFNFTEEPLPRIKTPDNSIRYLRSSEIDCSYLKYLLFFKQKKPVNFAINKELYKVSVDERTFPDGPDNPKLPWLGVNDFLSDALFVLPYDINDDYIGIEYVDENNGQSHRRCLLPIKAEALHYFPDLMKPETASDRISIRKSKDGSHYTVSLKIDILTETTQHSSMVIRREYWPNAYDDKLCVRGRVYEPKELDNFAFGVYPFVKSKNEINIYKILFYNQLKGRLSDKTLGMRFFYKDPEKTGEYAEYRFDQQSKCAQNYTSEYDATETNSRNRIYYSLETDKAGCGLDYIELSIKDEDPNKVEKIAGTALIIPVIQTVDASQVGQGGAETLIAIDLGTSNTYIAYKHGNEAISEINMVDEDNKAELRFMHQPVRLPFELNKRYTHDLCMQPSEEAAEGKNPEQQRTTWVQNIPDQLCEFIPTHIMKNTVETMNEAFTFPIPTLISPLRLNGSNRIEGLELSKNLPLVHSTIPFAYYDIGRRSFDAPRGNFKWFVDLRRGVTKSTGEKDALTLFISELLFIVRSHMLYKGFDLNQCKIIWTYPLAFDGRLKEQTETVWQEQFLRYFRTDAAKYEGHPQDCEYIEEYVKKTNESLSPFYYCQQFNTAGNAYQLLIDVGGGSSDILGFERGLPLFITSFDFAGNDLYLYKSKTQANIVRKCVDDLWQNSPDMKEMSKTEFPGMIRINNTDDLTSLMNYGFQKCPKAFNLLWSNSKLQFMLKFHCAAILYQTAQLCKWNKPDEVPNFIHLTGNGSKLFKLLNREELDKLITGIFAAVFGKEKKDINIEVKDKIPNPKFAAARGCLLGYDQISKENTDDKVVRKRSFIALGDGKVFKDQDGTVMQEGDDPSQLKQDVRKNVVDFINLFYSIHSSEHLDVTKDYVLKYLEMDTDRDTSITLSGDFRNLFFEYINGLMGGISGKLCELS